MKLAKATAQLQSPSGDAKSKKRKREKKANQADFEWRRCSGPMASAAQLGSTENFAFESTMWPRHKSWPAIAGNGQAFSRHRALILTGAAGLGGLSSLRMRIALSAMGVPGKSRSSWRAADSSALPFRWELLRRMFNLDLQTRGTRCHRLEPDKSY
jgi:hypothetical protein